MSDVDGGAERAAGASAAAAAPVPSPAESTVIEPTEAEIEVWAERERERRAAWLRGPTPEERAAFAQRERERRLAGLPRESESAAFARRMRLYPREAQLAAEGAVVLFLRWSRRGLSELVRAGRDWEDEVGQPPPRRRVPLEDDAS